MLGEQLVCLDGGPSVTAPRLPWASQDRGRAMLGTSAARQLQDEPESWGVGVVADEVRRMKLLAERRELLEGVVSYTRWRGLASGTVGVPFGGPVAPPVTAAPARSWAALRIELLDALAAEPVEDGVTHRGERAVAAALRGGLDAELAAAVRTLAAPLAAELLRLIARHRPDPVGGLWAKVVVEALAASVVEVRDAAIQLVESWATAELTALLATHREAVPWLAAYVSDVLRELRG